jgi:uncharacterized membrane protein
VSTLENEEHARPEGLGETSEGEDGAAPGRGPVSDHIAQNITSILELQQREREQAPAAQLRMERLSRLMGRPAYLVSLLTVALAWIVFNASARRLGLRPFDDPPFEILQGLLSLIALVTTTTVLIAQNRQTRLSEHRSHLDLQINLLTEQKVTKLIHLLEELRTDLPMVESRHDPHAAALKEPTSAAKVASALSETTLTGGESANKM